jgi:hypothetical protein
VAVGALDAGVGKAGDGNVRQRVGEDGEPVAGDYAASEEHIGQRRAEKVAEPLGPLQAAGEEGIVGAQDLDHAGGPADALSDAGGEGLGDETGGLWDIEIGGVQPNFCMRSEVWASSVMVSVAMPPASSRAARRMTAQEPQKKVLRKSWRLPSSRM